MRNDIVEKVWSLGIKGTKNKCYVPISLMSHISLYHQPMALLKYVSFVDLLIQWVQKFQVQKLYGLWAGLKWV